MSDTPMTEREEVGKTIRLEFPPIPPPKKITEGDIHIAVEDVIREAQEKRLSPTANDVLQSSDAVVAVVIESLRKTLPKIARKILELSTKKTGKKAALAVAAFSSMIAFACGNVEEQSSPPSAPTPAISELPTGMSSSEIEFVPTTETSATAISSEIPPSPTPTPEPTPKPTLQPTLQPEPTLTPQPTSTPEATKKTTDEPSFSFSESIPNDQKDEIRTATTQILSWLNPRIETPLEKVRIFADDNPERIVDLYLSRVPFADDVKVQEKQNLLRGATAWAGRNNDLYIVTTSRGWTLASPIVGGPIKEGRQHTIAHELLHLVQMRSGSHNHLFPYWLWEGSAHYVAAQFLGENNIYPYPNVVASHVREATPMLEGLESLEGPTFFRAGNPFADEYSLGFLATSHLTDGLPEGGVRELIRFWDAVGKGTPWRVAFQQVFSKTTQEYYLSFEALRQRGFK